MEESVSLYGGKVSINFTPKKHKYTAVLHEKGNKELKPISVTGITGVIDKSGPLVNWAVGLTIEYIRENIYPGLINSPDWDKFLDTARKQQYFTKKEAAGIGTAAHDWGEKYFKNLNPSMPPEGSPFSLCVDAIIKWSEQNHVQFLDNERIIYSLKHNFSGRMDGRALVNGVLSIIDFKTGNGIYEEAWLQTAAYNMAYEEETGEKIDQRVIIRLGKKDGHFYMQSQSRETLNKDWKAFLGAMAVHKRLSELKKTKKKVSTSKTWLDE